MMIFLPPFLTLYNLMYTFLSLLYVHLFKFFSSDRPSEILITWSTLLDAESVVRYGTVTGQKFVTTGYSTAFREQFIHRVRLQKVTPGAKHGIHRFHIVF